jgi:signal transduction histidine kinase
MKGRGRAAAATAAADRDDSLLEQLVHDLRNPLGVIAYFAEALTEAPEAERPEMCERLRINAGRALHVLEEFALLADLRHGRARAASSANRVALATLIDDLTAQIAAEQGSIALESALATDLELPGDVHQWQRALRALLREAVRAASGGVRIDGERAVAGPQLRISVPLRHDRDLRITASLDPGSLAVELMRRVAELYGGTLSVQQRPGLAVLEVSLPA